MSSGEVLVAPTETREGMESREGTENGEKTKMSASNVEERGALPMARGDSPESVEQQEPIQQSRRVDTEARIGLEDEHDRARPLNPVHTVNRPANSLRFQNTLQWPLTEDDPYTSPQVKYFLGILVFALLGILIIFAILFSGAVPTGYPGFIASSVPMTLLLLTAGASILNDIRQAAGFWMPARMDSSLLI